MDNSLWWPNVVNIKNIRRDLTSYFLSPQKLFYIHIHKIMFLYYTCMYIQRYAHKFINLHSLPFLHDIFISNTFHSNKSLEIS